MPTWTNGKSLTFIAINIAFKVRDVCSNQTVGTIYEVISLDISHSQAFKKFKNSIGQANHFLITILIGLDALEDNPEICARSDFKTTWNPADRNKSISRSRDYVKNASLTWIIDSLDSYLQSCNTKPKIIQSEDLKKELDTSGHSVYKKYNTIVKYVEIDGVLSAFVDLGICWRNNRVHSNAENKMLQESRDTLLENALMIKNNYCNLDVQRTLKSFDENKSPTFKEVTSITKAIICFVEQIDRELIKKLSEKEYINEVFDFYINKQIDKKSFVSTLKNLETNRRESKMKNIMGQYGITEFDEKLLDLDRYI